MPRISMTAAWLQAIKTDKSREIFHDVKVTGLGLRVSKSGRKVWQVLYRVKGDPTKRVVDIGDYPAITLGEARERAHTALAEAARGNDPSEKRRATKQAETFEELAQMYLERHAKPKKRSAFEDERIIARELLPHWKRRKAIEIKRRDVIAILEAIADRGAPIMANRTLALVRKIYNWGISVDLVESNPANKIPTLAKEKQRERFLSESEIRRAWQAFETIGGPLGEMFKLRLLTAQRGGEVASMRWEEVDLETAWWTIPAEKAKNGTTHRVPLSVPALEILLKLKALDLDSDWVFPSRIKSVGHLSNFQKPTNRIKEVAGLEDFCLHDLRRTAATYMGSLRVARLVISKILNHSEAGVTKIYERHSYDEEKREALDTWARKLLSIININVN